MSIVNNAAVNMGVYIYIHIFELMFLFSLNQDPEVELLDHMVVLFFIVLRNFCTVAESLCNMVGMEVG